LVYVLVTAIAVAHTDIIYNKKYKTPNIKLGGVGGGHAVEQLVETLRSNSISDGAIAIFY